MAVEAIARLLRPQSVAVFGASDDPGKYGGRIMHYLALHGYAGDIVPINSRRERVAGLPCYPSILDAPKVDVAVIATPAASVPQTIAECARAGVGACVVVTAGFSELGPAGAALQHEMLQHARATGMRIVGPNCMGLMNLHNGMALTAARVFDGPLHRGPIGLVSQSGAVMLSVFNRAQDLGIGFSQIVSVGNQADLETCDFLEYMIQDEQTEAICLHIEGLRDGARFRQLLLDARRAGKPVVVLKTGRTARGGQVAQSHTGSLAGAYPVFAAACAQAGAVLVEDPDVMVLAAQMLNRFGPCHGRRIAMLSPSGGFNAIVVDRLADRGLEMATFSDSTRQSLSRVLPQSHTANPLDLGVVQNAPALEATAEVTRLAAADPHVDLTFVPLTTSPDYERTVQAIVEPLLASGKPALVAVTPGSVADGVRGILRDSGIPYCDRIDDAARALDSYLNYPAEPLAITPAARQPDLELPAPGYVDEPRTKALLAAAGVRVTRERIVSSEAEALAAAREIGFPVVLKGVSDRVVHKSDAGLVRLALRDDAALVAAWRDVRERLGVLDPSARQCVVAEMAAGELELIVGVKHDPAFGPAVLVGAGGVLVDLLQDVAVGLAPLSEQSARRMLAQLKVAPLLSGYRGRPALDTEAIVETLVRIGSLAQACGGRLRELDINPLLVRAKGQGVIALDARSTFD